jgi:restriction system protein
MSSIFDKTHRYARRESHAYSKIDFWYDEPKREVTIEVYLDNGEQWGDVNQFGQGKEVVEEGKFLELMAELALTRCCEIGSARISGGVFSMSMPGRYAPSMPDVDLSAEERNFIFLDALSVIESSWRRKASEREIELGVVELALLRIVTGEPELLHKFDPREFEYFVAALLTSVGYQNVTLSRYWKDSGRDIWAIEVIGNSRQLVVFEIKHYENRGVGIEIIDRLNGVRDRFGADKGVVVTNSYFTKAAKEAYGSRQSRVSLVDFEALRGLLRQHQDWAETSHGLLYKR